jgi:hypothetical protein
MKLTINGKDQEYTGEEDRPLLWYLREDLKMTGTKFGCGVAACGACTVLVDGVPTRACITPAASLEGKKTRRSKGSIRRLDRPCRKPGPNWTSSSAAGASLARCWRRQRFSRPRPSQANSRSPMA